MAWIKKNRSSLLQKAYWTRDYCLAVNLSETIGTTQIYESTVVEYIKKFFWPFGLSSQNMKSTWPTHVEQTLYQTDFFRLSSQKYEWTRLNHVEYGLTFLRPSSHVVGKWVCLVMLWQKPARRDKQWNYIPPEFQRYTKLNMDTWYLYGHVENVWGIPFPKRMERKYCFLSELFQEQCFWLQIWLIGTTNWTTNRLDYKLIG